MAILRKLKSAARGFLWVIRPSGLHHSMVLKEEQDHDFANSLARFGGLVDHHIRNGLKEEIRQTNLARWREAGDLRAYERTVFSQNGEDGIIQEILRRIGIENKFFVEFGVEWGEVCNCARLVVEEHWQGLFIEAKRQYFEKLVERYRPYKNVQCANEYVNSTNIQKIFAAHGVPKELDLLSIDIDGNDYWVWAAIEDWRPRMVVIEYNPTKG